MATPTPAVIAIGNLERSQRTPDKRLQLVAKLDGFDPRRDLDANATRNWLGGINYYVKADDIKLQINYIRTDEAASSKDENRVLGGVQVIF